MRGMGGVDAGVELCVGQALGIGVRGEQVGRGGELYALKRG
jgi:hypothetical protein